MITARTGRQRVLAAAVATAALTTAGGVALTAPAQSAPPAGDCATATPISSLAKGDAVTGLTVSSGTTPDGFTGEVLGVVTDGIAPGVDMVMARLSSPEINRVGGIWQGMSGSPVYAADGSLIGAVAYGLSFGPSPVAGITPFAEMDDYMDGAAPSRVTVGHAQARSIARATEVSARQAEQGFRQIRMPISISGLSAHRLTAAKKAAGKHHGGHLFKGAWAAGASGTAADSGTEADMVPGGNLAATISYGDITAAGVGTVTSVCGDRLVGFGHPMMFRGSTSLGMSPASAVYVQEDPTLAGFKVANVGNPVGTVTDDHLTGITGTFDVLPSTTDVTSMVTYGGRDRTGTSHVTLSQATGDILYSQVLANHDRVVDGIQPGSESQTYRAQGTDATGAPFDISFADRYQSSYDISDSATWPVAWITYVLANMEGVEITSVDVGSVVSDDASTLRLSTVEQKVGGAWTKVSRRHPAVARRGGTLQLRASTTSSDGTTSLVPLSVTVPSKTGRFSELLVQGGGSDYPNIYGAHTPQDLADALARTPANDELVATLSFYGPHAAAPRSATSEPQSHVVDGSKRIPVVFMK